MTTLFTSTNLVLFVTSVIITGIAFYIIKTDSSSKELSTFDILKKVGMTFLISLISLLGINQGVNYMNSNNYFQKGGQQLKNDEDDDKEMNVVDDDVDTDLLNN
jgi:multisubunit Na+/H+ antiporter MnhB subunit